jgi:hypothetical protein
MLAVNAGGFTAQGNQSKETSLSLIRLRFGDATTQRLHLTIAFSYSQSNFALDPAVAKQEQNRISL